MAIPVDDFLPLPPAALHILLSLAAGDMHGYGIMQAVAEQSEGRYKLGPGTLYDNLQRLLDRGLIEDAGEGEDDGGRRRYYRLSTIGRAVARAEIARLESLIRRAKGYLEQPKPRRA